jgi:CheY-like chemotaxis protein
MVDLSAHRHALRQPLHAIGLFCAALRSAGVPAPAQGLIDGIEASSAAMETSLEALFTQLEAATAASVPSPAAAQRATEPVRPAQTLRARTAERRLVSADTPGTETVADEAPWAGPPRVLIVDDDPSARLSLELLLEAWGADVHSFGGTAELETFLTGTSDPAADLCIVDYHLGHAGEGLTALVMLRRAWPGQRLALVMMTGDVRAAHMAKQAQPDLEVLVKPVAPATLIALIERTTQGPAAAC